MPETEITIIIPPETQALIDRACSFPERALPAIARGMDRGLALASGQIVRTRFTGKGPFDPSEHKLGVRSNRLRNSIRWNVTGIPGETSGGAPSQVSGQTVSGTIGTNVGYMWPHEFGFNGQVSVAAFTRKQKSRDQFETVAGVSKSGRATKKKVLSASGIVFVRAHTRWMQMPERSPLRTGVAENAGTITGEIGTALQKEWEARG